MVKWNFSKKNIFVLVIFFVLIASLGAFWHVYENVEFAESDNWFIDDVESLSLDYARSIDTDGGVIQIRRYTYVEFDNEIAKKNEAKEIKEYPFSGVDVQIQIGKDIYIFHIVKDEQGELLVKSHELYK